MIEIAERKCSDHHPFLDTHFSRTNDDDDDWDQVRIQERIFLL